MKDFIDELYLREELPAKTRRRLLMVLFVDGMENKNSEYKNLLEYIKELMRLLKQQK